MPWEGEPAMMLVKNTYILAELNIKKTKKKETVFYIECISLL